MNTFDDNLKLAYARCIWNDFVSEWESDFSVEHLESPQEMVILAARPANQRQPKPSSFDILKQYKDDPNVYISYIGTLEETPSIRKNKKPRKEPKVGINPKSHYNTPLGIYTYPLKEIWDRIENSGSLSDVPYQGEKPYIAIIRVREDAKFINDMYNEYDSASYDEDKKKLRGYFTPTVLTDEEFEGIEKKALEKAKELNPVMSMWNVVRHLSYLVAMLKEPGADRETIVREMLNAYDLSDLMPDKSEGKLNPFGLAFNRILNGVLEYEGFADKSGKGYIHSSEPMQAVFLSPKSYDQIDIIDNENSSESDRANHRYKNEEKLERFIQKKGADLSEKVWTEILLGYPKHWDRCPYDSVRKSPQILDAADSHWARQIDPSNVMAIDLPEHVQDLPKTQAAIRNGWIKTIEKTPTYFSKAPEWVQQDAEMLKASHTGWENLLDTSPDNWEKCPYDDIKEMPELKAKAKAYWGEQVTHSSGYFEQIPEAFANDPEIFEKAIQSSIIAIEGNVEGWGDLNEKLRNDPRVLEKLGPAWIELVERSPNRLDNLPDHLKEDPIYAETAKQKIISLMEQYAIDDVYGSYGNNIPASLMKDKELMGIVVDKWKARVQEHGIEGMAYVPSELLVLPDFKEFGMQAWKDNLIENPNRMDRIPTAYKELNKDADMWKKILVNPKHGAHYTICPMAIVRNDPEVQAAAKQWWKKHVVRQPKYYKSIPTEFKDEIKADPEVHQSYLEHMRDLVATSPNEIEFDEIKDEELLKAYWEGARQFAENYPEYFSRLPEKVIDEFLKDPEIVEKWKEYWIRQAIRRPEFKNETPFKNNEIYGNPKVVKAIRDYVEQQLYEGNSSSFIDSALPELVEQIKNDPQYLKKRMEHWKEQIAGNPDRWDHYFDILGDDELAKNNLRDYTRKIWKKLIVDKGIIQISVPSGMMEEIIKEPKMQKIILDQWMEYVTRKK